MQILETSKTSMDSWAYTISNIHKICRICLEERKTMYNIYQRDNIYQMSVAELLKNCMSLKLEEDEELPSLVCTRCEAEVLQICEFRLKFEKSCKYLQEYLENLENVGKDQVVVTVIEENETEGNADGDSITGECLKEVLTGEIQVDSNVIEFVEESASDSEQPEIQKDTQVSKKKNTSDEEPCRYTCKKCKKNFNSRIKLTHHQRKFLHYTRKTVMCSQCKLVVPVQSYKSHFLRHSSDFSCKLCGKTFSNNFNLKRHLYIHTKQTPYVCNVCNAEFARQDKLKAHAMIHTSEKPFTCGTCGQQFRLRDKLKHHQEKVAPCNGEDYDYTNKYKRTLSCDVCSKSFALMSSLKTHQLLHTDERVICSSCGKPYPNEKKLKEHIMLVHSKKSKGEKEYLCNICAKQYSNKAILQRHILSHMGLAKSYKCKTCNKCFTQSGSLALHQKIHTGEKPFVCHICSRAFNKPSNLQRHLRSHANIRPHVCAICEKCFGVKQSLIVHMRTHTGEKPFTCPVCDKKFVDRGSMNKHIKIHSGQEGNSILPC